MKAAPIMAAAAVRRIGFEAVGARRVLPDWNAVEVADGRQLGYVLVDELQCNPTYRIRSLIAEPNDGAVQRFVRDLLHKVVVVIQLQLDWKGAWRAACTGSS